MKLSIFHVIVRNHGISEQEIARMIKAELPNALEVHHHESVEIPNKDVEVDESKLTHKHFTSLCPDPNPGRIWG